jgi:hypothetical protein
MRGCNGSAGVSYMRANGLAVVSFLIACASSGPAVADDIAAQQRDCMIDALTWCSQWIFAPDRDLKIGDCLWQHRAQISRACYAHLRPPKKSAPR